MGKKKLQEMSFLDHLEVLRWHLIRSTLAVFVVGIVAFISKRLIFDIILAPKNGDFFTYRFFCSISKKLGMDESLCITEIPFEVQAIDMAAQFSAHIWTSIWAGFILAFPYILFEVWRFISPGLYENERKGSRGFIIIASFLFFIGVLFGYYVIAPLSVNFLGNYQVSEQIDNNITLGSYIGTVRASVIAAGLVFELPIIIYFLTKMGLVTPEFLKKYRKFALVIVLVLSAVITPPDITSQIVVAVPIIILYEISIHISRIVLKREAKRSKKNG